MSDHDLLERKLEALTPPRIPLERLIRRRDRRIRNRRIGAGLLAVVLSVVFVAAYLRVASDRDRTAAPTPTPDPTVLDGLDLYAIDPVTNHVELVLAAPGAQYAPERSPDGSRIVYVSWIWHSGPPQLFVLEADGRPRQLTDVKGGAIDPTWSPDGTMIAFGGRGEAADIWVIGADGTGLRNVTNSPWWERGPDWSPDGDRLVYSSDRDHIAVVTLASGVVDPLTDRVNDYGAAWSPDGRWIAFSHFVPPQPDAPMFDNGHEFLWLMRPDGSDKHRIAGSGGQGFGFDGGGSPDWSPDGGSIVFTNGHQRVVMIMATGAERSLFSREVPVFPFDHENGSWTGDLAAVDWSSATEILFSSREF